MQKLLTHKFAHQNFQASRLVYFVAAEDGKKPVTREMSSTRKEELKNLKGFGGDTAKIARDYELGLIEEETFAYLLPILRDSEKRNSDKYKPLLKSVAKRKFHDRAIRVKAFAKHLEDENKTPEQLEAIRVLDRLSRTPAGNISLDKEKGLLKQITDAGLIVGNEDRTKTGSRAIDVLAHAPKELSWSPEKLSEEDDARLIEISTQFIVLNRSHEKKYAELEQALNAERKNDILIARLRKDLDSLKTQLTALNDEKTDIMATATAKWLRQYQALKIDFKRETGIEPKKGQKINLKIGGNWVTIEIKDVRFEAKDVTPSQIPGVGRREILRNAKEAPGELMIEYIDQNGHLIKKPSLAFGDMLNLFEGYEQISTVSELNKIVADELGHKDAKEGLELSADIPVGTDKTGKVKKHKKIIRIDEVDQRVGTITLNEEVVIIPAAALSRAVDNKLYKDRTRKTMKLGEFARFISRYGFKRKIAPDEVLEILKKKELEDFRAPESGEQTKVAFRNGDGRLREGTLTRKSDPGDPGDPEEAYYLTESPVISTANDNAAPYQDRIKDLMRMGLPAQYAFADLPKTKWSGGGQKGVKKISARELIDMVDNRRIIMNGDARNLGVPAWTHGLATKRGTWGIEKSNKIAAFAAAGLKTPPAMPLASQPPVGGGDENGDDPAGGGGGSIPPSSSKSQEPKDDGPKVSTQRTRAAYEEALPYEAIFKTGNVTKKETSYIEDLWLQTKLFSVQDFWEFGKSMYEFHVRRYERKQKDRYSSIGKHLPYFAPEMQRINQDAETQEVNQFKDSFAQKGVFEIQERLKKSKNRDEIKAAFIALSEKGQLRWDDIEMWANLNKWVSADLAIPIPGNGDPYNRISATDERTGFDYLKNAIDSLWGEGQFNDWSSRNKSTFQTNARNNYEKGKELEGLEGGHGRRLAFLLSEHKKGEFVDPHEYEGLILHSIEFGKAVMQEKLYFMIEGAAAVNSDGRTILSFDRIGHINSEMLIRFPILEYICASVPRPPDGKSHKFTLDDYKSWVRMFDDGDPANPYKCKPGKAVDDFLWKYVIPSNENRRRVNKALRNAELNMDHDDMFAYLPPATTQVITDVTGSVSGSGKKFLTVEGYKNAFPGFSQYFKSLSETDNRLKLRDGIKSYVRYESIITNKYRMGDEKYQRFDSGTFKQGTIVTPNVSCEAYIGELNGIIDQIAAAYSDPELNDILAVIRNPVSKEEFMSTEGKARQQKVQIALDKFDDVFDRVIKKDHGRSLTAVVREANLRGLPFGLTAEEMAKTKQLFAKDEGVSDRGD